MHLNECFRDAFTFNSPWQMNTISDCIGTWGLKTTTSFHNNDELNLPWWFGALCFSFSVAGFTMLMLKPKWTKESRFPYVFYATSLIFIQGPFSFMADYVHMTNDSFFHVTDRIIACCLLSMEFIRLFIMSSHLRTSTLYLYMATVAFAMFSFVNSQLSQSEQCTSGFIYWHALWHLCPLIGTFILVADKFILGEFDGTIRKKDKKINDEREKVKFLSTIASAIK